MKEFTLVRLQTSDQGTIGHLISHDGNFRWLTLELPWRKNRFNISCIPAGEYHAEQKYSPRFDKALYRLRDSETAPRSAILIHEGNFAGDTKKGYKSDAQGCILLGTQVASFGGQMAVFDSVKAMNAFHAHCDGQPIHIRILEVQT